MQGFQKEQVEKKGKEQELEEEVEQVRVRSTCRKRWDFRQFLIDNPHLKPKAVNYFYCSRERV